MVTHLLFDGGTLTVKPEESDTFIETYVRRLQEGKQLHIIEKRTPLFKFYLDIDYLNNGDMVPMFIDIFKLVVKIVNKGECLIAKASERFIEGKGTKYGYHLIWPRYIVNKQTAEACRQRILNEFGNEWLSIFDSFSSGLRMLWSHKNESGSTVYEPYGVLTVDGVFTEFEDKTPSVYFLKLFSIQSLEEDTSESDKSITLDQNTLEMFIERHFKGHTRLKITKMEKCKSDNGDLWVACSSKYCENIKREHKSNHVYFIISKSDLSIHQRCLDNECKGFKSKKRKLPIGTIKDLLNL
jgi:hypothetical protein